MKLEDIKKPDELTYTSQKVADFIGVSYATLYRMVKNGKIKVVNIARTGTKPIWRFRAEDVKEYYDRLQDSTKQHNRIPKEGEQADLS